MRKILQMILKILAKIMLLRYKPKVIAITGNVGKTSAKDAVYIVLKESFKVRKSEKSFNNEIGVPLAILGIKPAGKNILIWCLNFLKIFLSFFWVPYPKILILEFGADKPGDIDCLLSIVKPDIAVVTAIGEVPAHVENFISPAEVTREKTKLVRAVSKDGIVILNTDYEPVITMRSKTKAKVVTYGFSENADLRVYRPDFGEQNTSETKTSLGASFKVEYEGSVVPVRLNAYGTPNVYAASAACAIGVVFGLNLVDISESLLKYKAPQGRLNILNGIKSSVILDDSYNASPSSMKEGLKTLANIKGGRKVAVLGSMLEIGKYTEETHREMGKFASSFCDIIITVGDQARFIADEALKYSFKKDKNLFVFDTSNDLAKKIKDLIEGDDIILFKGSRGIKLEVAIKEILAEPENAKKLLVS